MRVGREERALPRSKLEGIRKYVPRGYVFKICTKERGRRREVFDTIFEPILDCFADAIKLFATMKSRPPTDEIYAARVVTRSRMGEVGYSKSQPESKFDFRAARDHRSAVFFFFSNIFLFLPSPLPCFFAPRLRYRGAARPEVAQTRQGSYLLEERVLRVTAGCSLFLDYCYAGTGREEDRESGWRRKNGRVCMGGGGGGKRAKETRWMEVERVRELPSENIESRAYHSAK